MKKPNVKSVKAKPVKLTVDGRELDFILDLNAFSELEDTYGGLQEIMTRVEAGSMKAVRAVLWAGLQSNDNPPTEKQVGKNISIGDLEDYMKLIVEAMGVSLPEKDENDPN
jgi:hypothetical protein